MENNEPISISKEELAELLRGVKHPQRTACNMLLKRSGGSGTKEGSHFYNTGERFLPCIMLRATYRGSRDMVGKILFVPGRKYDMFMLVHSKPVCNAVADLWIMSGSKCTRIPYSETGLRNVWPAAYEAYREQFSEEDAR